VPKLFTKTQALLGAGIFDRECMTCHGPTLQGKTAPPVAGTAFLKKTTLLGWTVENMRGLVVTSMPLTNPGSLSPKEYAAVIAYLLSSSCYPAGNTPFPTHSDKTLEDTKLVAPAGITPKDKKLGTCPLE
jgi:hypothetical protein